MLSALALLSLLGADARVEIVGAPPPFTLEAGFVEVVPEAPLLARVRDVGEDDELIVELVRLGPLGKGRAKASLLVQGAVELKRTLSILAPTLAARPVGGAFASLPLRQRAPLSPGTSQLELRVDAPMGVKLSVAKRTTTEALALVPLIVPTAPVTTPALPPVVTPPTTAATPATAELIYPAAPAPAERALAAVPAEGAAVDGLAAAPAMEPVATTEVAQPAAPSAWPRLLAEVHAGPALVFGGLQDFVPSGGARVLIGPRNLDAALGFAVDFDGQSAFIGGGSWNVASTRVRMDGHLGLGDLALLQARLALTLGAGARFAEHSASLAGVRRTVFVVGVTTRAAPEVSVPAGPGRFVVALPLDVTFDMPSPVKGFTPVAAGVFLGYRLDL